MIYLPGTDTYNKVVEAFGSCVVNEDKTINRKILGGIVFGKKSEMEKLNAIMWPAIHDTVVEKLTALKDTG